MTFYEWWDKNGRYHPDRSEYDKRKSLAEYVWHCAVLETRGSPQLDIVDIWNEEMTFKMTRATWADLLDGKPIGRVYVMVDGAIRVERKTERKSG